jgi:phosphonate transport system ATP-binding protein
MLLLDHLSKTYPNGTAALRDVTLTVGEGEFVAVVGLSGAGKSTLMRCVNRLVEPSAGRVLLDGADVTAAEGRALREVRARVGMVFQQFNLVRRLPVLTNVLVGRLGATPSWWSLAHRFDAADVRQALANLERVGLRELAGQRADTLSGGQQQRVGIARALMQRPRLLLADEPVASLDPATSHSIMRYLEALNRDEGVSVLCNLHFLSLARRYATRVVALRAGEIVFDGLPADLDERRFRTIYGEDAEDVEVR